MKYQNEFIILQDLFLKIVNKYKQLENYPLKFGTDVLLYSSEIHFIEVVGHNPDNNITQLAEKYGVTKGAVSQLVKKLEKNGLLRKFKSAENAKEVLIRLTEKGTTAFRHHDELHLQINKSLFKEIENLESQEIELLLHSFKTLDSFISDALESMKLLSE